MNYPKPAILADCVPGPAQSQGYSYVPQYGGMSFTLALPKRMLFDFAETDNSESNFFQGRSFKQKLIMVGLCVLAGFVVIVIMKHIINRRR